MKYGSVEWRSILSLKASVIVGFVLTWNLGFSVAIYVNGGMTRMSFPAAWIIGATCFIASGFFAAIAMSGRFREFVLAPTRQHNFRRGDFVFLAFLVGTLGVLVPISAASFISATGG